MPKRDRNSKDPANQVRRRKAPSKRATHKHSTDKDSSIDAQTKDQGLAPKATSGRKPRQNPKEPRKPRGNKYPNQDLSPRGTLKPDRRDHEDLTKPVVTNRRDPNNTGGNDRPPRQQEEIKPEPKPEKEKQLANPLCLLPMRLEYRYFEGNSQVVLRDAKASREKGELVTRKKKVDDAGALWFRWFPDDNFAEEGAQTLTPEERAAFDRYMAHPSATRYPDDRDPTLAGAWGAFVQDVGEARAVHLFRNRGDIAALENTDASLRNGHICGLPVKVQLYGVFGRTIKQIAEGGKIPFDKSDGKASVSYSPAQIDGGTWISDFDTAVEAGMGVRVTDPDMIAAAFEAEWIIAVGLYGEDGVVEMEAFLADAAAHGKIAFLDAETPTNNAGEEKSGAALWRRMDDENALDQSSEGAGELLAHALGVSARPLRQSINSAIPYKRAAAAMMRVVGPVLLDNRLDGASALDGLSEVRFIDLIAESFLSRGSQAPIQIGDCAYGVVTLTQSDAFDASELADPNMQKIAAFVQLYARLLGPTLAATADRVTLRIEPGDPDSAEKLGEILKANKGGRRIDVAPEGADETKPLGCPYIDGPQDKMKAAQYLNDLRVMKISSLKDPDEDARSWPLLYRLARRSLHRNVRYQIARPNSQTHINPTSMDRIEGLPIGVLGGSVWRQAAWAEQQSLSGLGRDGSGLQGLPGDRAEVVQEVAKSFSDALRILRSIAGEPDGVARLESLLIEVVDFLQYRLDAWALGMAHAKLMDQRAQKDPGGLELGYFGFLGKLRSVSATGHSDGYLQAPSPAQASAAAVMRATYLRHGGQGAMAISQTSDTVQKGVALVDLIRKGHTLSQALGLFGERWLRRSKQTNLVADLRHEFPIENPDQNGSGQSAPAAQMVFDGLAFTRESEVSGKRRALHNAMRAALDSFADLVMAEAVYARAIGSAERANAWLQVLSGDPIPERPSFLRTERPLQASDHKVSLWLSAGSKAGADIFAEAEPTLLPLINGVWPDVGKLQVTVSIRDLKTDKVMESHRLKLVGKVFAGPVELMLSDASAARRRVLTYLRRVKGLGTELTQRLGPRPLGEDSGLSIEVHLSPSETTLEAFFDTIAPIVKMIRRARPLEPNDMAPIARSPGPIDETMAARLWAAAAKNLHTRANRISRKLEKAYGDLSAARQRLVDDIAENYVSWGSNLGVDKLRDAAAEDNLKALNSAIWQMKSLLPGEVLPLESLSTWIADLEGEERRVLALETAIVTRFKAAQRNLVNLKSLPDTLEAARGAAQGARVAIRHLVGRDRFPVFPSFPLDDAIAPEITNETQVLSGLDEWPKLRSRLNGATTLASLDPTWQLLIGVDRGFDSPDDDPRSENDAPRLHHFGKIIAQQGTLGTSKTLQGFVVDEWTENRPSMAQPATLALNYDGPQAEAPNAIVLGVPASAKSGIWTPDMAAELIDELIKWTRIRTMTTQNTGLPTTVLPGSNLVGQKLVDGEWINRIPEASRYAMTQSAHKLRGTFQSRAGDQGLSGSGLREISGRSKRSGK